VAYEIKAGDVVVTPVGTGHWLTRIDDRIDYVMVRIDPTKSRRRKRGAFAGLFVEAGQARRMNGL
jgi:quercetin dioxygenase-like cupin family protein